MPPIVSYNSLRPIPYWEKHLVHHQTQRSISPRQYFTYENKSSVTLAIEKLRAYWNNVKLLVPRTITNQRHIATGSIT